MTLLMVIVIWTLIAALLYRFILRKQSRTQLKQWQIMNRFELMIQKADSGKNFTAYNAPIHVGLSICSLIIGYFISRQYLGAISAISSSLMCGLMPTLVIKIIQGINDQRLRKESGNFFATFSNYCSTGQDIFSAFRLSIPEIEEPFKAVISRMIKQYDSRVDPIICLQTASESLDAMELKSFFKTLIFQYIEGGDVVRLTNDFIRDLGQLVELDEKEAAEDRILNIGIYMLVSAQFLILGLFLRSNERDLIIGTLYGEIALTINILLSLLMILLTFIKPRRL